MSHMKSVLASLAASVVCFTVSAEIVPVTVPNNYAPDGYYRYAPATLVDSGVRHVFYCRNISSRVVVDGIYHAVQAADGTLGPETLVLSPADSTGTAWDSYHVADPSVIAGAFYYEGHVYRYLMAYLGVKGRPGDATSDGAKSINNKVGFAVSDSLTSGWTRMGTDPVVITEHLDWWGVGQPSLLSVDGAGKVALFYAGDYETRMMNLDFTDAAATAASLATKVGDQGVWLGKTGVMDLKGTTLRMTITNADFAYDAARKLLYMIADTPDSLANWYDDGGQYLYIAKAVSVYRTPVDALANMNLAAADWELVARFQPSDLAADYSTAARCHNSGFVRTEAGGFVGFQANVSVANVKNDALYTYRFMPVSWTETPEDGFIEFTATYPMNLRHFFGPNTKVSVDFAFTDKTTLQQRIIGTKWHYGIYINGSSKFSYQTSTNENQSVGAVDMGLPADTLRHTGIIDAPEKRFIHITAGVTNSTKAFKSQKTETATWPLFLCGASNAANGEKYVVPSKAAERYNAKAKIYGVKIWESGSLVHDYQPQIQDGLAGLKDLVDGVFLPAGKLAAAPVANAVPGGNIPRTVGDAFLQTEGHQGITTDYKLTPSSRLVLDYAYVDAAQNQRMVSGGSYAANGGLYLDWYNNPGQHIVFIHDGAGDWSSTKALGYNTLSTAPATNLFVRRSYSLDIAAGKYFVSTAGYTNETQNMKAPLPTLNATAALKLFHGNASQMAKVRFYGAKIYENGVLTRDYVPYVTNGVACVYETQVGTIFYNDQGTNSVAFVAGGNITSVGAGSDDSYLQSDGTQGIILDYYSKSDTKLEIDFALDDFTAQTRIFGVDGSNSKAVQVLYSSGDCKFSFINNSTWASAIGSGITADNLRHTAVIDRVNNTFSLTRMNAADWSTTFSTIHSNTSLWPMGVFGGVTSATGGFNASRLAKMKLYAFRIYESGTLVHEFLPYKNGETTGLYDTKTGAIKTNSVSGGQPFTLGGRGANGDADMVVVRPADATISKDNSAPLKVYAPGAVRYVWTVNGQKLDETTGEVSVPWMPGRKSSAVTVTPVYMMFGTETLGTPISVTVNNIPLGMTFLIR